LVSSGKGCFDIPQKAENRSRIFANLGNWNKFAEAGLPAPPLRLRSGQEPVTMPQGLHRIYGGSDLHVLTFSCYRRRPLFDDPTLCDLFLSALERVRRHYRLVVLGYVVMPEHVHLLVSEPQRSTALDCHTGAEAQFCSKFGNESWRSRSHVWIIPMSRKISETWGTPKMIRFSR
jgi:REP element-mobilizing transposase RayT